MDRFFESGIFGSNQGMSYIEQFEAGWVPDSLNMEGDWIVRGLFGPLPVRFFGHQKQFAPTQLNEFAGNNRFLGFLPVGYFNASVGPSQLSPELQVINIDYDVDKNPWIMKGLTDEVRFVENDKLLGRGVYQPHGFDKVKARNIFWFSVSRS